MSYWEQYLYKMLHGLFSKQCISLVIHASPWSLRSILVTTDFSTLDESFIRGIWMTLLVSLVAPVDCFMT